MKKLFILILFVFTNILIKAQVVPIPLGFKDYYDRNNTLSYLKSATSLYAPNGKQQTPHGDLRALIVFVGFGPTYDNSHTDYAGWPSSPDALPDYATNKQTFYNDYSDFTTYANVSSNRNISKLYYIMSNQKFRFIATSYPKRINIDATGSSSWNELDSMAIQQMKLVDPNFDWSLYDNRYNKPMFGIDNSINPTPDYKPDYIIFVYRYLSSWALPSPTIPASDGGYSSDYSIGLKGITYGNYTFDNCGFVGAGTSDLFSLFIHESGHSLYDSPHYGNNNNVVGNYFYGEQSGWGLMCLSTTAPYNCALGWERWWLDWISLQSNGVNSDVTDATKLPTNGIFTIRDFITTGDVIRIKIPNTTQYLWLENHKLISEFDPRDWQTDGCGNPFPPSPKGIIAYIESISDNKSSPYIFYQANAIRYLHAIGNFDYTFQLNPTQPCQLWNNYAYNYSENAGNPISGQNRGDLIRGDFYREYYDNTTGSYIIDRSTTDNSISINNEVNVCGGTNGISNEGSWVIERNGNITLDVMGQNIAFTAGQKMGLARNPCITNRPQYDGVQTMGEYNLNGISVIILSYQSNGDAQVQVSFNDVNIDQDTRWAGSSINLPNITGDANPDVNVLSNVTVLIDKSGTPNRHTKNSYTGDFTNPTVFTCMSGSYYKMQPLSNTFVQNSSALILQSGSTFEINDGAILLIKAGSTLEIQSGANLVVKGSGCVVIENGGYLCVETGAAINLQEAQSAINLHSGYILGINHNVISGSGNNCVVSISAISKIGSGSINIYNIDKYIQNQTISTNQYIPGHNVSAGSNVTSANPPGPGPATITSGAKNVVFDAEGNILLDKGFEVQAGAGFEAKNK